MTNGGEARRAELWSAVDGMLERAALPGILAHRLGPLAGNRLRRLGSTLPEALAAEERAASLSLLTGVPLVQRVREQCDGELMLLKGPEIARLYPGQARRFSDIDVLTADAWATQRALLAAGFVEIDDPLIDVEGGHHHLLPLKWPTIWLKVEVHLSPNFPRGAPGATFAELFEARVPSATGVADVFAPAPLHHTLILAAHAWLHEPLDLLRDLVDIAAVSADVDERELERTARAWGIGRLWATTRSTTDALFYGGRSTVPLRTWARHLELVRERTVLERHVGRLVQGFWALPPHLAFADGVRGLPYLIKPLPGESWGEKAARTGRALRRPGKHVGRRGGR